MTRRIAGVEAGGGGDDYLDLDEVDGGVGLGEKAAAADSSGGGLIRVSVTLFDAWRHGRQDIYVSISCWTSLPTCSDMNL